MEGGSNDRWCHFTPIPMSLWKKEIWPSDSFVQSWKPWVLLSIVNLPARQSLGKGGGHEWYMVSPHTNSDAPVKCKEIWQLDFVFVQSWKPQVLLSIVNLPDRQSLEEGGGRNDGWHHLITPWSLWKTKNIMAVTDSFSPGNHKYCCWLETYQPGRTMLPSWLNFYLGYMLLLGSPCSSSLVLHRAQCGPWVMVVTILYHFWF